LTILLEGEAPLWSKFLVVATATVFVAGLRRPFIAWAIERIGEVIPRVKSSGSVPDTSRLWRSTCWTVLPIVLSSAAFALLLGGSAGPLDFVNTMGAFALSWLVGFALFFLPSGLGAREAMLIALLPAFPTAQIVGVSVIHRFSGLVAELIVLSVVSHHAFVRPKRVEG
jgi:uncharacterized membrane protein YbhN (UPF0104 family)